ncbi:transmembrane reductase CYB561D2 [Denticeps clupeoides]|uniref:ascorbate ferrireductase (transmembrane) n=1 Tax=Denticeps clupeoides TaxID=299321 RepID=A0AAY3ZYF1_9TELE|nr:cytochrome b561 domain-containing protein 2-like [Denticeps clupeoides]
MAPQSLSAEPRVLALSRLVCGLLTHLLVLVFSVFVAVLAKPGSSLFSWHPFLMTASFFFMTEALLLFSPHCSPAWKLTHASRSRIHWALQCLSVTCACLGLVAISFNKHLNEKPHFTTWHGLVGIATVLVVAVQCVAGLPLVYIKLAKGWSLSRLKRYHATSGLTVYLLACSSLLLGTCSIWFTSSVSTYTWYLMALIPAFSALVIMSQVSSAYVAKKRLQC